MASGNFEDLILRDTAANRPAASIPGRLFYDTTNEKWQRDNGATWDDCEPSGGGTIGGSTGSTDNAIIRADGTGGSTVQSSLAVVDDSGGINIPTGQTYNINGSPHTHAGGGGATIYESAYASPPGSPADGDLWLITDGLLHARRTSGAWSYYYGTQKVTKPVLGNFSTWFNQGSATLDDYGQLVLYTPAAGTNLRGAVMAVPATPYNIDAIFVAGVENVTWMGAGLCWSDGTKYISALIGNISGGNASPGLDVYKWNTATGPASGYTPDYAQAATYPIRALPNAPVWVRLSDDGANRTVYISLDAGKHFQRYHQVGNTDFLTATQIGICLYSDNANVATTMSLLHWAQS